MALLPASAHSLADYDEFFDNLESPDDFSEDIDLEFEADELLALNLNRASLRRIRQQGIRVRSRKALNSLGLSLWRLRPPPGMLAEDALRIINTQDPDGYYDRNQRYSLASGGLSETCSGIRCYGQQLVRWSASACTNPAKVGILDSALNLEALGLPNNALKSRRFGPGQADSKQRDHGTAIAAMLAGSAAELATGLLPAAQLVAADVFFLDASGNITTDTATLAEGIDWLIENQAAVVNVSMTGPDSPILHTVISRAAKREVLIVAAAGNFGPQAPPQYPAAYPDVLAITAVDRGLLLYPKANHGDYLDLAAPGVDIWTINGSGQGVFMQGTSFAAPFATAAAARLVGMGVPPLQVRDQLLAQAQDLGQPGRDTEFGWGLLQFSECPGNSVTSQDQPSPEGT